MFSRAPARRLAAPARTGRGCACPGPRSRCAGSFPARRQQSDRRWKRGFAARRPTAAATHQCRWRGSRRRPRGGRTGTCWCRARMTSASSGAKAGLRSKAARLRWGIGRSLPRSRACASAGSSGHMRAQRLSIAFAACFAGGAAPGVVILEKRRLQRHLRLEPGRSRGRAMIRASAVRSNSRRSGSPGHQNHTRAALVARLRSLPRATAARQFVQIVARVLDGCPALPLSAERSMSYPHWLLAFDQEARGSD